MPKIVNKEGMKTKREVANQWIMEYIQAELNSGKSQTDIANLMGISRSLINLLLLIDTTIAEKTGHTPCYVKKYIAAERKKGLKIKAITAKLCGERQNWSFFLNRLGEKKMQKICRKLHIEYDDICRP